MSGFKIVAIVTALSITGVVLITRIIDKQSFASLYRSSTAESAPSIVNSKLPDKTDSRGRSHTAKKGSPAEQAGELALSSPAAAINTAGASDLKRDYPQKIRTGMIRSQLLDEFGAPTMRIIETRNGKVVERFIYIDRTRHTRTVAVLEDGRAVRSNTAPYFGAN
jgi:hypothetical protein